MFGQHAIPVLSLQLMQQKPDDVKHSTIIIVVKHLELDIEYDSFLIELLITSPLAWI